MWNYHSIPDAQQLAALPILPLARVVLLPGMVLPINVHEPASHALVDHVRHHGQHLGVPLALPGAPLPRVFTLARILSHVEISRTRCLIRVLGVGRVEAVADPPAEQPMRALAVRALAEPRPRDPLQLALLRAQVERILADADPSCLGLRILLDVRDDRVFLYALTSCLPALELMPHVELDHAEPEHAELDPDDLSATQQQCLAAANADERAALLVARTAAVLVSLSHSHRAANTLH
jgi:Lon protease-like protein